MNRFIGSRILDRPSGKTVFLAAVPRQARTAPNRAGVSFDRLLIFAFRKVRPNCIVPRHKGASAQRHVYATTHRHASTHKDRDAEHLITTVNLIVEKGGRGKSTTTIHLAVALAHRQQHVLLVNSDKASGSALRMWAVPQRDARAVAG